MMDIAPLEYQLQTWSPSGFYAHHLHIMKCFVLETSIIAIGVIIKWWPVDWYIFQKDRSEKAPHHSVSACHKNNHITSPFAPCVVWDLDSYVLTNIYGGELRAPPGRLDTILYMPFRGIVDKPILGHETVPPCYFPLLKRPLLAAITVTVPHTLFPRTSTCESILVNLLLMVRILFSHT